MVLANGEDFGGTNVMVDVVDAILCGSESRYRYGRPRRQSIEMEGSS
jgi:hypothetical protein